MEDGRRRHVKFCAGDYAVQALARGGVGPGDDHEIAPRFRYGCDLRRHVMRIGDLLVVQLIFEVRLAAGPETRVKSYGG